VKLKGPFKYEITVVDTDQCKVCGANGETTFKDPVTKNCPKLYVFSSNSEIL